MRITNEEGPVLEIKACNQRSSLVLEKRGIVKGKVELAKET